MRRRRPRGSGPPAEKCIRPCAAAGDSGRGGAGLGGAARGGSDLVGDVVAERGLLAADGHEALDVPRDLLRAPPPTLRRAATPAPDRTKSASRGMGGEGMRAAPPSQWNGGGYRRGSARASARLVRGEKLLPVLLGGGFIGGLDGLAEVLHYLGNLAAHCKCRETHPVQT